MVFIYTLKLQKNKYYIGKTDNPKFRLDAHFNSYGSAWTNLYKPIKLLELIPNCDNYDEDKYTIKYMAKYGIINVRGGSFVSIDLDNSTIEHLTHMINASNDKCYICGKKGHFAKDCDEMDFSESDSSEEEYTVWLCDYCNKEFLDENKCRNHENKCKAKYEEDDDDDDNNNACFRCGREGHYVSSCYASKHIKGYYLKK
jgi:hypothetical protein